MKAQLFRSLERSVQPNFCFAMLATAAMLAAPTAIAAAAPRPVTVRNLMSGFVEFWHAARDKRPDIQLKLWREFYQDPNARLFADLKTVCGNDFQARVLETQYFPMLKSLIPGIRALSASLPKMIVSVESRFVKAFPDMRWKGPIYIMASAGCFNGRSQVIQGQPALMLGVDDIVGARETNLAPLITHEMFHRYNYNFFRYQPQLPQPVWVRLWAEGMATFVAWRLNPSASTYDVTWIEPAEVTEINARIGAIARMFQRHFNSLSHASMLDFFTSRGSNKEIPARVGYYLGLKVAEYLARRYSMQAMAHWNHQQAKPRILIALEHFARSQASGPRGRLNGASKSASARDSPRSALSSLAQND